MKLESTIEALLFYKAEPVSIKKLAELTGHSEPDVINAISLLKNSLTDRGLIIIEKDNEVMLGTSPEVSQIIEKIAKEELSRDLGKAGLETLSIILYKSPVSRSEIDYIRGVNSSFIVRNLLIRGLIERVPNPKDSRSYLYKPTFDLMSYLGIGSLQDLPDRDKVTSEIEKFEESNKVETESKENTDQNEGLEQ